MIIVPTRELAIQIENELREFVSGMKIFSVCCVGGAPIGKQIRDLRFEYNFVIGTPGRLKDLIDRKMIKLRAVKTNSHGHYYKANKYPTQMIVIDNEEDVTMYILRNSSR
jgi:hypothetical protein